MDGAPSFFALFKTKQSVYGSYLLGCCFFQRRGEARAGAEDDAEMTRETSVAPRPMRRLGAVGDGADDLRREGVAEAVNDEEIDGDGGGADRRGDRVDDGGVERAGVEEEEELGGKKRGDGPGSAGRRRAERRRAG